MAPSTALGCPNPGNPGCWVVSVWISHRAAGNPLEPLKQQTEPHPCLQDLWQATGNRPLGTLFHHIFRKWHLACSWLKPFCMLTDPGNLHTWQGEASWAACCSIRAVQLQNSVSRPNTATVGSLGPLLGHPKHNFWLNYLDIYSDMDFFFIVFLFCLPVHWEHRPLILSNCSSLRRRLWQGQGLAGLV